MARYIYLFVTSIVLYLCVWIVQASNIALIGFSEIISVPLLLLILIAEILYVTLLHGNWKIFVSVETILVLIYLDPLYFYQKTFWGKYIPQIIIQLFHLNSYYVYHCCQSNICFFGGITLVVYLFLFTPAFIEIEKV